MIAYQAPLKDLKFVLYDLLHYEQHYQNLSKSSALTRDDIDAIDICVPNNLHRDIAIAAAEAGKWVLCEKPLSMNVDEAVERIRKGFGG